MSNTYGFQNLFLKNVFGGIFLISWCLCNVRWLQPESYVDPQQTVILHNADEMAGRANGLSINVPVTLSILTRDQYSIATSVPNLRVSHAYTSCSFI